MPFYRYLFSVNKKDTDIILEELIRFDMNIDDQNFKEERQFLICDPNYKYSFMNYVDTNTLINKYGYNIAFNLSIKKLV